MMMGPRFPFFFLAAITLAFFHLHPHLRGNALESSSGIFGYGFRSLGATVDSLFNQILQETVHDFTHPDAPLQNCGEALPSNVRCRRFLKNEPQDATELLPFILNDEEAMKLWEEHFRRHVGDAVKAAAERDGGVHTPLQIPVLKTFAEELFWDSRPAVSKGAHQYLRVRMERLKLEAAERGEDPELAVGWKSGISDRFKYHSLKDAKRLMGTYLRNYSNPDKPPVPLGEPLPVKLTSNKNSKKVIEETNFDARVAFPKCKNVIGHVRDQGDCGSCWAFASTEALNDRYCIKTGGKHLELLSPQHTTSCCDLLHCLSFGCNGGQPHMAWRWFSNNGVVTGGDYSDMHTGRSCWPYEIPFCQHHSQGPYPQCNGPLPSAPKCRKDCEESEYQNKVKSFKNDLHFANNAYSVPGRDEVKRELMENGSLTSAFLVFEDFLLYKKGVYHHLSGGPLGGHAIKVIGFGQEDGRNYWLAVNSWNEYWGDKGTFKIEMGQAGIDTEFCGGEAKGEEEGKEEEFGLKASQDL